MREPKGVVFPLSVPRRLIVDLLHFARRVPSIPLSRLMDVSALMAARRTNPARPSWSVIFMKAYAKVAMEHPPLRRALLEFPWQRIYEHPQTNCSLAIERQFGGEEGVFFGMFRAPEGQTIGELQRSLVEFKNLPLEQIGFFRRMIRISRFPDPDPSISLGDQPVRLRPGQRQAVRDLRRHHARGPRRRAGPPALTADDDAHLRPHRRLGQGHRQDHLRSPRPRRRLMSRGGWSTSKRP